jgi:hypothetical protein
MKNKGFIEVKIENILKKRYALEKIIPLKDFFWVFFLTLLSYVIFFFFWLWAAKEKKLHDVTDITDPALYVGILMVMLLIGYLTWKMIGNYIPKFVLIGLLGWFLIGGGLISNIVVPGGIADPQPETENGKVTNIQLPASRFTGLNEKSVKEAEIVLSISTIDQFLAPAVKHATKPSILQEKEFTSNRLVFFILLVLVTAILYFRVIMFKGPGKNRFFSMTLSWRKREFAIKFYIIIIVFLSTALFFLTMNFLFLLTTLLALANIFLIKWEIRERGQNHKIFTRSVLFLFLIQFFSMVAGEIFFLIYLPIFLYIKHGYQVLSLHDAIMLNWIVIVGSLASALIGMTTQVVWSGRRLTEKFN